MTLQEFEILMSEETKPKKDLKEATVVTVDVTVDQALKLLSELQFEKFKARIEGDHAKASAFDEEINRLSKALEESIEEAIRNK